MGEYVTHSSVVAPVKFKAGLAMPSPVLMPKISLKILGGSFFSHRYLSHNEEIDLYTKIKFRIISDIRPVTPLDNGKFLLAWWHYDGGSTGEEEFEHFKDRVSRYFTN